MDPLSPRTSWIVIESDRIVASGHGEEWRSFRHRNTRLIDCTGKTILPGFVDVHMHLVSYVKSLVTLDLSCRKGVLSIADIQSILHACSQNKPPGTWILARGYDEFHLAERRHPNRWDLDKVTPYHPVRLTHRSGHAHVLNSLALKRVGITKETGDPDGGLIERDLGTGEPTGVLYEMGDFLSRRIPPLSPAEIEQGLEKAAHELVSMGITSIQDASSHNDQDQWKLLSSWKASRSLRPRINMMLGYQAFKDESYRSFPEYEDENQLRLGAVKIILDHTSGQLYPSQTDLNAMVLEIHRAGLQVAIHAIEEESIKAACAAVKYALDRVPRKDHRHRIEHCSVCPPSLAGQIASLGITVVSQPAFIYYSGDRYLETVPETQLKHLYAFRTLLSRGINVSGSSDCPVVPPNPLAGMGAAVLRTSSTGRILGDREKISMLEALRMYTRNAAFAHFEESSRGTITPGKLADLVVLNADPLQLPQDALKDLETEMTIVGGQIVWEKEG
ncbi:MAG: amidohydrolase [Deltaproteobacteria bacterium]|nr:amidohydrolase [Deltaproteobacteria bacterium]